MNILAYVKDMDGSSYHRIYNPNARNVSKLATDDLDWCDVLVYSRHCPIPAHVIKGLAQKHKFKVIVDTDDWWFVPDDHPKAEIWNMTKTAFEIESHLSYADSVTTTTNTLKTQIPNNHVYVIPNSIDYGRGQFKYKKQKPSEKVRLLYASTIMNYQNTAIIAGVMKKVKHLPLEIIIAGHHDSPIFDILVDRLTAGGAIPYRFKPFKHATDYMSEYEGDIGLLPSKATKFNSFKSNLKVLEYAALKMPVLVSKNEPYFGLPVNYFTGDNSFISELEKLMDAKERAKAGTELYNFCKKNYKLDYKQREDVYARVLQNGV